MAESVPFSTFAVFAGGSCAAEVACFAPDVTTTPPVAMTATRTAAPASTHVFRLTGRSPPPPPRSRGTSASRRWSPLAPRVLAAADGIRVVSMRGPFAVGSGKSGTPLSRMHWANLRAASCCWAAPRAAHEPRWLQVLARADGLLERRGVRVQRRAVRYPIDGERARRVRVREVADAVGCACTGRTSPPAQALAAGLPCRRVGRQVRSNRTR